MLSEDYEKGEIVGRAEWMDEGDAECFIFSVVKLCAVCLTSGRDRMKSGL